MLEATRYAIYYAPVTSEPWWQFGCRWLGCDPISGQRFAPMAIEGFSADEVAAMTAAPQRYGFHATLKAPFMLSNGARAYDLYRAAADFTHGQQPLDIGEARLDQLDGSVALLPDTTPVLAEFAQTCVEYFDFLRAPPTQAEIDRRREAPLTPRHEELLQRWGYPYVMEAFRLHFTLTARLADAPRRAVIEQLRPRVEALRPHRLRLDALYLFEQTASDASFRLIRRYGFDGTLTCFQAPGAYRPPLARAVRRG